MRKVIVGLIVLAALMLAAMGVWSMMRSGGMLEELEGSLGLSSSSTASLGLVLADEAEGVYVLAVTADSQAERAGIHPGDYLRMADGETLESASSLNELVVQAEQLLLTVRRNGQETTVTLPCK